MNSNDKISLTSRMFGPAYEQDERIRAAVDKAGHNSFLVLMAGVFICMTAGLLLKHTELAIISGAYLLVGNLSYLLFMVKGSAFSLDMQHSNGKSKKKQVSGLVIGSLIFVILDFLLNVYSNSGSQMTITRIAWMSLIKALMWGMLMLVMFKGLIRWSEKRADEKINEGEEKGI